MTVRKVSFPYEVIGFAWRARGVQTKKNGQKKGASKGGKARAFDVAQYLIDSGHKGERAGERRFLERLLWLLGPGCGKTGTDKKNFIEDNKSRKEQMEVGLPKCIVTGKKDSGGRGERGAGGGGRKEAEIQRGNLQQGTRKLNGFCQSCGEEGTKEEEGKERNTRKQTILS